MIVEVVGALAYTLHEAGVDPLLICQFRFSFAQVLDDIYPARTESPYGASASIHKRLEENSIEYLILSTCSSSLPLLKESILRSTVHVICVVHHSGPDVYHKQKKDWTPLAEQGRLTLLLLGHHVALEIKKDVEGWAEQEESYIWENLPVHVLLPKSILQDAGVWGYERVDAGSPAVPKTGSDASPFQLLLLGQRSKYSSLTIPVELENVIQIHEGLAYPEFYAMIAASVPVLGSSRLLRAYSYLNGPAVLLRDISESEISALRRIRSKSAWRRAEDVPAAAQWQTLHDDILAVNLDMWRRVLI
ncbi:hypothetical protein QFC21_005867 [Naganishia friedmannii]|uniref:Uncharacterized protein n=1 Tax=Naganishia friedmannii TaxID=89922 RepID=A0ACC2V724_9TREE|nr:hypothetical protein QFC21_005867 [Naganishia friedmannii]